MSLIEIPDIIRVIAPAEPRIIRVIAPGAPGPPGPPGEFLDLDSIARLRAFDIPVLSSDLAFVESWHFGLRRGGGFFLLDSADTTSPDNGGTVIVDALARRWKRMLEGGKLTFAMFGAKGIDADPLADDTAAINRAFDEVRLAALTSVGMYIKQLGGQGLVYGCSGTIDVGFITNGRNCLIEDFGIYSSAVGKPAMELTGSSILMLDKITIEGSATSPPEFGWWSARLNIAGEDEDQVVLPSASLTIGRLECFGTYIKAAFCNYGCEVFSVDCLKTSNRYWRNNACCSMFVGHSDVIANFCGLPTTTLHVYGIGLRSMSVVRLGMHNAQRGFAYAYVITNITKSSPPVVTIGVADMAAGASFGLANGVKIHLENIKGDGTGQFNWANTLGGRVCTVANLDSGAGTFEIPGFDTTAVVDNFVSGTLHNDTGPSVVLGSAVSFKEEKTYHTAYSDAKYLLDVTTNTDRNWNIELQGSYEPHGPAIVRIKGNDLQTYIRNLWIKDHNGRSNKAPIIIDGVSGTGSIVLAGGGIEIGHRGQIPRDGIVSNPGACELRGFKIVVPDELSWTPTGQFFADPTYDLLTAADAPYVRYFGPRKWSTANDDSSGADLVTIEAVKASAIAGPVISFRRQNSAAATNNILAYLKMIGSDSAGIDHIYAALRAQIVTATNGAEDGRLDFMVAKAGANAAREAFLDKYGFKGIYKSQVVAANANLALSVLSDYVQIFHTGTLTVDRTVTLSTAGAIDGAKFRITRTGGGAFNLNVGTGPLKALATNTWGDFVYDGSSAAWKLSAYGVL